MKARLLFHNRLLAAIVPIFLAAPVWAQDMDALYDQLAKATPEEAPRIERQITAEWSKSGSASMDLLLARGNEALEAGDIDAAIEHFTALTDHAPDFAEGWNARALAFFQKGLYGQAVEDIGRTLTLNPHHFGAISGLAAMFEEMDRPKQALEAYKAALAIHPNLAGVREAVDRLEADTEGQEI
ncbi:tetratricopeptide repeat protein [Falsirhodobacter xinxiangensis]|uniref:tetratricopeptide repeat protein n=1 Tax=Falsirhodobacter xinxiangensis TaxID=2530049 RepID=UPI0010AAA3D2|nr:tetratricopeptide repeat protein [Rhodobacter xinxiangensis]